MAANQTIIQAVADAETRIPVDFTDQINMYKTVAQVLVASQKAAQDKTGTLGDEAIATATPEYFQLALGPVHDMYNEAHSIKASSLPWSDESKAANYTIKSIDSFVQRVKEDDDLVKEYILEIGEHIENNQISGFTDPLIENYWNSIASGEFEPVQEMYGMSFANPQQFFRVNLETLQYEIIGPDGQYTSIQDLPAKPTLKSDTEKVYTIIKDFNKYALKVNSADLTVESEKVEYNKHKNMYIGEIQKEIKDNHQLLGPLMVDQELGSFGDLGGVKTPISFMDWYFNQLTEINDEFGVQWNNWLDEEARRAAEDPTYIPPTEREIIKMKQMIFKSAFEADENIKTDDWNKYLNEVMDSYVN